MQTNGPRLLDGIYDLEFRVDGGADLVGDDPDLSCSTSIVIGERFGFGNDVAECHGTLTVDGDTVTATCEIQFIDPSDDKATFPLGPDGAKISFSGEIVPAGVGFVAKGTLPGTSKRFTCTAKVDPDKRF